MVKMKSKKWQDIEKIARRWCSIKNDNMKLEKMNVCFCSNGAFEVFEFDIASHPNRKEIAELDYKIKQYKAAHGVDNIQDTQYFTQLTGLYSFLADKTDHREIVGMVKARKHDRSRNAYVSILGDCFLLARAKADKKYMILTDKTLYDYFLSRCSLILEDIELVYLDLAKHKHLLNDS